MDKVVAELNESPFNTSLQGDQLKEFQDKMSALAKQTNTFQKSAVNLDIKIKKWAGTPEDVLSVMAALRSRAKVVNDLLTAYETKKSGYEASKMEMSVCAYEIEIGEVSSAFHVLYFRERALDLARFCNLDDFVAFVSSEGESSYIEKNMKNSLDHGQKSALVSDVIAQRRRVGDCAGP